MIIVYILLQLLFLLFVIFFITAFFTGAPFVPTPRRIVEEMIRVGKVGKGDRVIDLGSGDGRLVIAAAKHGAQGVGWEINPVLALISFFFVLRHGLSGKVRIRWGDYRKADMRQANIIMMYSIAGVHIRTITDKCRRELSPGARILSYRFRLPDFPCIRKTASGIFLYRIPDAKRP